MNTVLSSYGQLSGCPEILKKSCKFFCRGLDIRVPEVMKAYGGINSILFNQGLEPVINTVRPEKFPVWSCHYFVHGKTGCFLLRI